MVQAGSKGAMFYYVGATFGQAYKDYKPDLNALTVKSWFILDPGTKEAGTTCCTYLLIKG